MYRLQRRVLVPFIGLILILGAISICAAEETTKQETLSLNEALTIAFQNNSLIQIAQKEVEIARDKAAQAHAGYYPKVTLYGGVSRFNELPTSVELGNQLIGLNNGLDQFADQMVYYSGLLGDPRAAVWTGLANGLEQQNYLDDSLTYYGMQLVIEQPLYTGNRLGALKRQAASNEVYSEANLVTVKTNVAFEVKKAYYTVVYAQRTVATLQKAVAGMELHVREAEDYYKAGMVPKLDVIRAEVKLADLRQKLMMANNGFEMSKKALSFILGIDIARDYIVEDSAAFTTFEKSLGECQTIALDNRPELKAINAKIDMAEQGIELVKSGQRPLVGLQVKGDDTQPYSNGPSVSVNLVASLTIYDGGMVKNKVAEAEDILKQAQIAKEHLTKAVQLEVEQAYRNLAAAKETIQVSSISIDQAKEAVRMADVSYKAGLCTSLERIDAEIALTQAESNYTQALSLYNTALAQLQKAMGLQEEELK